MNLVLRNLFAFYIKYKLNAQLNNVTNYFQNLYIFNQEFENNKKGNEMTGKGAGVESTEL
jgi:hypothetical protein